MLSVFDNGPPPPCPAPFNLAAYVLARAAEQPDKTALAVVGLTRAECWSYRHLEQAVRGIGTGLLRAGLRPGDRVLMRLGNSVEFPTAYLGAIAVGIVPVPTSTQLIAPEVSAILDTVRPAAILLDPGIACPRTSIPVIDQGQLRAMHDLPSATWDMGSPDRPAYIIYTSGTSGTPRAVVHAHRAIWARHMMFDGWYGLRESDRLCHAGAFNWTYTLGTGLLDPWTVGATALIPEPGIDPAELPLLMNRHDATIFAAAPGVYRKMLNADSTVVLPTLRHGLSAGEKLSETIAATWRAATDKPLHEAYGLSECSTFISNSPDHPGDSGMLGRPQPGRRVAIMGPDGPVPCGAEGTIAVHSSDPGLMLEYLDAPNETRARFHGEWFLTGDQATMDPEGRITYLGRADDMMNAGGYRVSPIEVEAVLNAHPGITQAAVTDIEVRRDARVIMAFYTAAAPVPEHELHAHLAKHLAAYKRPRGFFHLDSLPSGPNGKILRRDLRPIYEARHGQA